MATTSTVQKPTPEKIFNTLNAFHQTAALKTAIELDVFTAIADGAQGAKSIAAKVSASERGVRILCDFLVIHGFLNKVESRYQLTEEAAIFLSKRSPAYLGTIIGFIAKDWEKSNYVNLTEVVKRGGSITPDGDNKKPNDEAWVPFARSMAPMMAPAAKFITELVDAPMGKTIKVLDIAAGHGMFGVTIAKQHSNAQITAVDWPAVLEVAKENAEKHGVTSQYSVRPGSAFETDLGADYDYVLLTNIFHHFDIATCEKLMKRVHGALKPGGKAITLEFVPNDDRVTPTTPASFSLIMLVSTNLGDAYTFAEYNSMFANSGFAGTTMHPVSGMPQTVLVSEKAA